MAAGHGQSQPGHDKKTKTMNKERHVPTFVRCPSEARSLPRVVVVEWEVVGSGPEMVVYGDSTGFQEVCHERWACHGGATT
jgi:hypothetical protein